MKQVFRVTGGILAATAVLVVLVAGALTGAAVAGASGVGEDYPEHVDLVPGTSLMRVDTRPSWGIVGLLTVCQRIDLRRYPDDCVGFVLHRDSGTVHEEGDDSVVVQHPDLAATVAEVSGSLVLDPAPGFDPLVVSLYAMGVLSALVLAAVLWQVGRLLFAAAGDDPFTEVAVRRLRRAGVLLAGWAVLEPVLWLFLSPKAWDWTSAVYGPVPSFELGSMEGGGIAWTRLLFGVLLVLLGEVFRHGMRLAEEQRMTV